MFDKLKRKLKTLGEGSPAFDPSRFHDPVAPKTEWTPKKSGSASFRTHRLVEIDCTRVEFRASTGAVLFYLAFLVPGVVVAIGSAVPLLVSEQVHALVPLLVGLVFAAVGGALLYFGTAPIVFDKTNGQFWKGRNAQAASARSTDRSAPLENIHAIQLIAECCSSDDSSYYSYELNLVLDGGRRINVVDHGNKGKLREDARRLSVFMGKPVWDAI